MNKKAFVPSDPKWSSNSNKYNIKLVTRINHYIIYLLLFGFTEIVANFSIASKFSPHKT